MSRNPAIDLDEVESVLEKGDLARAQYLHGSALVANGLPEEAREAFSRALALDKNDVELLHASAELLVLDFPDERDDLEDAVSFVDRALKLARAPEDEPRRADLTLLKAMAMNKLGACAEALALLDGLAELLPDDPEVALERGIALFELCRFEEAEKQLARVQQLAPKQGWASYFLGLIAERRGDHARAQKLLKDAAKKNPDDFPGAVELSNEAFEKAVDDALASLPEKVQSYLGNVSIAVEDLPSDDDLQAEQPPLSPCILGLFRGTPITEQSTNDPWSYFPSAILLYQKNLQRFVRSRDELIEQIGITLIHEVGHFLGLSEDDLYERGLD